jgi:hypothetical protein
MVPLTVRGAYSQTANLQEWRNSTGTLINWMTAAGQLRLNGPGYPGGSAAPALYISRAPTGDGKAVVVDDSYDREAVQIGVKAANGNMGGYVNLAGDLAELKLQSDTSGTLYGSLSMQYQSPVFTSNAGFQIVPHTRFGPFVYLAATEVAPQILLVPSAANVVGMLIQGAASQSSNLLELQNSSSTVAAAFNATGSGYLASRLGIAKTNPKTALEVVGTVSGSALTVSSLSSCASLQTSSAGALSCGGNTVNTGALITTFDRRYVNVGGDTMTGALRINWRGTSSGGTLLNVAGTMSGRSLYISGTGSTPMLMTHVASGNVGIGTSTPGAKLQINTVGGGSDPSLRLYATAFGTSVNFDFYGYGTPILSIDKRVAATIGNLANGVIYYNDYQGHTFTKSDGTSSALFIDLLGNVGINSTSPTVKLLVAGSGAFTGTNSRVSIGKAAALTALDVVGTISGSTVFASNSLRSSGSLVTLGNITTQSGSLWQPVYHTDDGLVGYWNFSESGSSIAYDRSPYGNDGTLTNGPTYTQGKFGTALSFDGTNDNVAHNLNVNFPYVTVEAWIKTSAAGSLQMISENDGSPRMWQLRLETNGTINFTVFVGPSTYAEAIGTVAINDGNWHHVTGTFDGQTVRAYVDGNLHARASLSGTLQQATVTAHIGMYPGNVAPFNGTIDEVRIYNRPLSLQEIRTQYLGVKANSAVISDSFRILNTSNSLLLNLNSASRTLEVMGTMSGRTLRAQDSLASSGTLVIKGTSMFQNNINVRGTISGSALTIMNGNSYLLGNVGIGKTSPSTKLDVVGTMSGKSLRVTSGLFAGSGSAMVPLTVRGAVSQSANLQEWQDSTSAVVAAIAPSGRLGLGTSPSATANQWINMPNSYIYQDASEIDIRHNGLFVVANQANTIYPFIVSSAAAPTARVTVTTFAAATKGLVIVGNSGQTGNLQEWQNSSGTPLALIDASGNLGLGTSNTSVAKLSVAGTMSGRSLYISGTGATPLIATNNPTGTIMMGRTSMITGTGMMAPHIQTNARAQMRRA